MGRLASHLVSFALGAVLIVALGFYSQHDLRYLLSPALHFANGASYKGPLNQQGQAEGYGKMVWTNGDQYEGEFSAGLFEGTGTLSLASSDNYTGQFHLGYMEGIGKLTYENDDLYEGQFVTGLFEGRGKLTTRMGAIYEGDFHKGEMTGKGKWIYSDKSSYVGEVKNGFAYGKGEWLYADGGKYSGDYIDGKKQGQGSYVTEQGTYTGAFIGDQFTGKGIYKGENGILYEGTFADWELEGEGIKTDKNGNQWKGPFKFGELSGEGSYVGKDGEAYTGQFEYGRYSGKGKLRAANGDMYDGEFKYGRKDGKGLLTLKEPLDGVLQIRGRWDNDRLVEGDETTKIYSSEAVVDYAIYHQQSALAQALNKVKASDPNKVELYSLVVAAYGTQEVFRRESKFIENLFTTQYANQATSIYLTNSQRSLNEHPLATLTGIKDSLARLSQQMDKEKDVLFLYITSHGSKDKKISLEHNGLGLGDIEASWLGSLLKTSGIKHKVVVLSACYSGGFIDELKDESTIVITSAAADRTSFGCSDDSHFTYFAKAYFKESFPENSDFVDSFYRAQKLVETWEKNEKQKASNPQIYIAAPVAEYLKRVDLKVH